MSETGPIPDTVACRGCRAAIVWLWAPRANGGAGGWQKFTSEPEAWVLRWHGSLTECRDGMQEGKP